MTGAACRAIQAAAADELSSPAPDWWGGRRRGQAAAISLPWTGGGISSTGLRRVPAANRAGAFFEVRRIPVSTISRSCCCRSASDIAVDMVQGARRRPHSVRVVAFLAEAQQHPAGVGAGGSAAERQVAGTTVEQEAKEEADTAEGDAAAAEQNAEDALDEAAWALHEADRAERVAKSSGHLAMSAALVSLAVLVGDAIASYWTVLSIRRTLAEADEKLAQVPPEVREEH
mmetsp:Transcript_95250/g.275303  ORF Transcript_95250/g.275303 Transcript_95250/m.275303 type:complete len:230 (-) Transcript_95250:62-751(-)